MTRSCLPTIAPTREWPAPKLENARLVYEDLAAKRATLRGLPPIVSLLTSELCDLRCTMCERAVRPGTRKLPEQALRAVIEQLFPTAFKAYVVGSHGEPLLGDFDTIQAGALDHGVKLDMTTNGTHLSLDRYRAARDALMRVNVSLDAHDPEVYQRIRRGSRFEQVHANLRAIAAERARHPDGVVLDLSAVLMRSNAPLLPDFVRFAADLGVDHVHIQALRHFPRAVPAEEPSDDPKGRARTDHAGGRGYLLGKDQPTGTVARHLDAIAAAAQAAAVNVTFGDFLRPAVTHRVIPTKLDGLAPPPGLCWSLGLNFAVQVDGSVHPCCHPTSHRLGNVLGSSVDEIWNGNAMRRLREAHHARRRVPFCSGCIEAPYLPNRKPGAGWTDHARLAIRHHGDRWLSQRIRHWLG